MIIESERERAREGEREGERERGRMRERERESKRSPVKSTHQLAPSGDQVRPTTSLRSAVGLWYKPLRVIAEARRFAARSVSPFG